MCTRAGGSAPASAMAARICRLHPGLAEMTSDAPVASTAAALRAPSSPAAAGCHQVVHPGRAAAGPAVPHFHQVQPGDRAQQVPGLLPDALGVPEVARLVVHGAHRQRVPGGPRPGRRSRARVAPSWPARSWPAPFPSGPGPVPTVPTAAASRLARNSLRSRTLLPSRCARSAQPSPSAPWPAANSWPYSFIADPQPAEFTTITSTPAASKVAIVRRANRTASLARPVCSDSAPQQPCPAGMTTSQPSAASTRAVASFTPGKNTDCTHPVSMPTTARRGPCAAIRPGRACTTARSLAVSASRRRGRRDPERGDQLRGQPVG